MRPRESHGICPEGTTRTLSVFDYQSPNVLHRPTQCARSDLWLNVPPQAVWNYQGRIIEDAHRHFLTCSILSRLCNKITMRDKRTAEIFLFVLRQLATH